jgi:hypothetical protein
VPWSAWRSRRHRRVLIRGHRVQPGSPCAQYGAVRRVQGGRPGATTVGGALTSARAYPRWRALAAGGGPPWGSGAGTCIQTSGLIDRGERVNAERVCAMRQTAETPRHLIVPWPAVIHICVRLPAHR